MQDEIKSILELDITSEIERESDIPATFKRYRSGERRHLAQVTTLGVHHTGVAGGLGATASIVKQIERGEIFVGEAAKQYPVPQQARLVRYRRLPYHAVYSPKDNCNSCIWPAWMRTHHGDRMNRYTIGWALDIDSRVDSPDFELCILAGLHTVNVYRAQGCDLRYLETHSQHAAKPYDPGPAIMRNVLIPLAERAGLEIVWSAQSGNGKAWKWGDFA